MMETPKKHLEIRLAQVLRRRLLGILFKLDKYHCQDSMKAAERNNLMIMIKAMLLPCIAM